MAYRIQNHSPNFAPPHGIDTNGNGPANCTYVPRQIPRSELIKLVPQMWITSYDQHHQASKLQANLLFENSFYTYLFSTRYS